MVSMSSRSVAALSRGFDVRHRIDHDTRILRQSGDLVDVARGEHVVAEEAFVRLVDCLVVADVRQKVSLTTGNVDQWL